jgi:hypothetical protein
MRLAAAQAPDAGPGNRRGHTGLVSASEYGSQPLARTARASQESGPGRDAADHGYQATDQIPVCSRTVSTAGGQSNISAAAVAAYRTSVESGKPLSERKLAGMFGKTSRRWARSRIAEARRGPGTGTESSHGHS